MISDFFCDEVTVIEKIEAWTDYVDWMSKKKYSETSYQVVCRITDANDRDRALALVDWVDDVETKVWKLYTYPTVTIKPTDIILYNGERYIVQTCYAAKNRSSNHHKKYLIKMVE